MWQRNGAETAKSWVLVASILGSSMAFIDGTVVNVALPTLQFSLHASLPEMQWVVEAYALLLAALLLVGGPRAIDTAAAKCFLSVSPFSPLPPLGADSPEMFRSSLRCAASKASAPRCSFREAWP